MDDWMAAYLDDLARLNPNDPFLELAKSGAPITSYDPSTQTSTVTTLTQTEVASLNQTEVIGRSNPVVMQATTVQEKYDAEMVRLFGQQYLDNPQWFENPDQFNVPNEVNVPVDDAIHELVDLPSERLVGYATQDESYNLISKPVVSTSLSVQPVALVIGILLIWWVMR
jgi:hypothetical protein